jgi:hypothetical protein
VRNVDQSAEADGLETRNGLDSGPGCWRRCCKKMRRSSFSWIVSLLLLLAQHGAVLHELSHLDRSHATGTALRDDAQRPESGLCLTCEAFSQVTNPAAGASLHLPLAPAALIPSADPLYSIIAATAPTPRSRGPPQV